MLNRNQCETVLSRFKATLIDLHLELERTVDAAQRNAIEAEISELRSVVITIEHELKK